MAKSPEEWFKQAAYDMATAHILLKARRYSYALFMCHLAVEKGLKGLYWKETTELPDKIHNLLHFVEKLNLDLPADLQRALMTLNRLSSASRYPDDLDKLKKDFPARRTRELIEKGKASLKWLRDRFAKP